MKQVFRKDCFVSLYLMETFNLYSPNHLLSAYIQHYWTIKSSDIIPISERTVPFGNIQIFFHREQPLFSRTDQQTQPKAFVSGMSTSYQDVITTGALDMLVVTFRPEGAKAFLNLPLTLLNNKNIPLTDLEDHSLKELTRLVCNEQENQKCIQLIEEYFLKKLFSFDNYNLRRLFPTIHLINNSTQLNISQLSDIACLSPRQFNRIFSENIGSTPKEFYRIIRFQRALYILQSNSSLPLTQLAYEAGYYDQPHLIKEFKQFSGFTPKEYVNLCDPHSDYFTSL